MDRSVTRLVGNNPSASILVIAQQEVLSQSIIWRILAASHTAKAPLSDLPDDFWSRQTDHLIGTSAHTLQGPRSRILSWAL
ncbi:hypothetical protein TNCV_4108471 [Trichonephila clavipes]|nr:hypothetical protein TNCV_4108471 [Trichonephila clavipes]